MSTKSTGEKSSSIPRSVYGLCLLIILGFILFISRNRRVKTDLKINGIIVKARIVDYIPPGKGLVSANYLCEFVHNDSLKRLVSTSSVVVNKAEYVGKTFPALYSANTNTLRILINDEDFDKYQVKDTFSGEN